ncbi:hypothetical protein Hamer_G010444 [Homarus americanus]|uniref:Uncharacterized protein n=1 Tax=Homarus americanus TaxID=6706 RepID=A0A8J5JZC8_HOMAM|nr:hypothetical protein Hamer_G010444 [Homarus americanus]
MDIVSVDNNRRVCGPEPAAGGGRGRLWACGCGRGRTWPLRDHWCSGQGGGRGLTPLR